jgi:hypothetical protein
MRTSLAVRPPVQKRRSPPRLGMAFFAFVSFASCDPQRIAAYATLWEDVKR